MAFDMLIVKSKYVQLSAHLIGFLDAAVLLHHLLLLELSRFLNDDSINRPHCHHDAESSESSGAKLFPEEEHAENNLQRCSPYHVKPRRKVSKSLQQQHIKRSKR